MFFFRFPKRDSLRRKWLEAIFEENVNLRHNMVYLCLARHFEERCLKRTLIDVTRLRDDSVPTIFVAPQQQGSN